MSHTLMSAESSASAVLHGRRALTPLISAVVSCSFVVAAWVVGFIVHYVKRQRLETAAVAAGYKNYKDSIVSKPALNTTRYYIPPDPAVVDHGSGSAIVPPEVLVEEVEEAAEDRLEEETIPRSDITEPGSPSSQRLSSDLAMTPSSTTLLMSPWLGSNSPDDITTTSMLSNRDSNSQYTISYRMSGL